MLLICTCVDTMSKHEKKDIHTHTYILNSKSSVINCILTIYYITTSIHCENFVSGIAYINLMWDYETKNIINSQRKKKRSWTFENVKINQFRAQSIRASLKMKGLN